MVEITLPYVLSAFSLILRKMILNYTQPIFFQSIRLAIAGILLLGYLFFFQRSKLRILRKDILLFGQVTIFFVYLSYILAELTLDTLSSARFAFMFNLVPLITAVIAYFYQADRLNKKQIACLVIGFIGFLPLIFVENNPGVNSASFFSLAGFQLFISTTAYAYGWILVGQLVNKRGYSPFLVTGTAFLLGGCISLVTSFIFEDWLGTIPVTDIKRFVLYLVSIVFISEIVASNIYAMLLKRYSVTLLAFAGILYPIFSAFFGWIFFGEMITINFLVAMIIVSGALYFYKKA